MSDEGFHEIQLNGKQLVFLFMSAVVVAVVVFLCGVMVGRGMPQPGTAVIAAGADTAIDPTAAVPRPSAPVARTAADRPPVSTQESLTYAERLEGPMPPPETLREAPVVAEPPPAEPPPPAAPVEEAVATPAEQAPRASTAEPPGDGWVVQVGAYPRGTAESIASALAAKGFPTFITPRGGLFAVRVGKYSDRREAEAMGRRLEQDEQFKEPWVTR